MQGWGMGGKRDSVLLGTKRRQAKRCKVGENVDVGGHREEFGFYCHCSEIVPGQLLIAWTQRRRIWEGESRHWVSGGYPAGRWRERLRVSGLSPRVGRKVAEEREMRGRAWSSVWGLLSLRCLYHPKRDISARGSRAQTEGLARKHSLGVPRIQGHRWPWERMGSAWERTEPWGKQGGPHSQVGEESESGVTQTGQQEGARRKTRDTIGKR